MLSAKVLKQSGKLSRCIVHLLPKTRHDLSCSKQDGACGARCCGKPPFLPHARLHGQSRAVTTPKGPKRIPLPGLWRWGLRASSEAMQPRAAPTHWGPGERLPDSGREAHPCLWELLLPEGLVPAWATAPLWHSPTLPGRRPCRARPRCRLMSWPSPPPKAQGGGTGPAWPPPGSPHHYWPPRRCWPQRCAPTTWNDSWIHIIANAEKAILCWDLTGKPDMFPSPGEGSRRLTCA